MGYDMYIVGEVPGAAEVLHAAEGPFHAAVAERDRLPHGSDAWKDAQLAVRTALMAREAARLEYFHLNVWGMRKALDLMTAFRMAHDRDPGPFPDPKTFGLGPYVDDDDTSEPATDYRTAVARHLAQVGDEPGIPLFKLSSNDGWHVVPGEAYSAVRLYQRFRDRIPGGAEALIAEIEAPWWDRWIAYLSRAACHGGFEVH